MSREITKLNRFDREALGETMSGKSPRVSFECMVRLMENGLLREDTENIYDTDARLEQRNLTEKGRELVGPSSHGEHARARTAPHA